MPIFEFTCNTCGNNRKFSVLVGVVADAAAPGCPRCGGTDLKKAVSRFARLRSEDDALDSLADRADQADLDDPRTMHRFMKEMASEMGEDGEDLEEMLDESIGEDAADGGGDDPGAGGALDD